MANLPLLYLSEFTRGSEEEQRSFGFRLANSFAAHGFVKLGSHGVSDDTLARLFQFSRKFFEMSLENKMKAAHPPQPNPHRGYSQVGQEILSRVNGSIEKNQAECQVRDIKESFDQGPADDQLFPNVWPDAEDIPGFQTFMESFFEINHSILILVLQALAVGMDLPLNHFDAIHNRKEHELRILHYPAIALSELQRGDQTRVAEHTDFGSLTLLFQDSCGGLEIEDPKSPGTFLPVLCELPALLVNIGDSLQRWTNDTLKATCHRVSIPAVLQSDYQGSAREKIVPERYSVAFFGKGNRDVSLLPFEKFVSDGQPARYEHITAFEFNQAKLALTY